MRVNKAQFEAMFPPGTEGGRRTIIRAVDVKKVYRMGAIETQALRGVTVDIYEGEYLSIMGPSGSGKSTLFNMIGGLAKPTAGKVYIDQVDIAQLDHNELAWLRCRKIGYVFQTYNLIRVMTCLENVMLPMSFAGLDSEEAREKAMYILKLVGLAHRPLHKPGELSGGQQQRCALARALANSPDIVLADEPTANLDQHTGEEMIELFATLRDELGVTIISATHDLKMLKRSDRILWIEDGQIVRDMTKGAGGTHGPQHPFQLVVRTPDHPITKGLPGKFMHTADELYSKLRGPAKNLTVLATAHSDLTNENEPILMAITFGKGRIFHTVLGHGPASMVDIGFQATLLRGTEWAATGHVTLPAPNPEAMPADKVVKREPPTTPEK